MTDNLVKLADLLRIAGEILLELNSKHEAGLLPYDLEALITNFKERL